ncbi:MAG: secretin N-terminal domain-containing protein [bacterium]
MKPPLFSKINRYTAFCLVMSFCLACAIDKNYRYGLNALKNGDYYAAVDYLEKAGQKNPANFEIAVALEKARNSAAASFLEKAQKSLDEDDCNAARDLLEKAVLYDPGYPGVGQLYDEIEKRIRAGQAFREGVRFERDNNLSTALQWYREALRLYPLHRAAAAKIDQIADFKESVQTGDPEVVKVTFQIEDMPLRDVFTALASVAKINLLIDESVQDDRMVSVHLDDIDVVQAMEDIAATHGLMMVKLESNTRILCADTPETRFRYGREDVRLFPLQYADADRIKVLLEPVADTAVILADQRTNSVVVRTRPDQMNLVSELIQALDIRESEVLVEVEILEVTRNRMEEIGLDLGENAFVKASLGGAVKQSGSAGTLTVSELSDITGGKIFLTVPSLYLKLIKKDSHTKVLAQPRLRIVNRTPARLHIGEQVPIKVAGSFFRNTSEELSSYQYRDIGIVLNMTPRILSDSELALDLKLAVSAITRESSEGHPTIGTREVETTLRLRHGEVEIIAGLIKEDERKGSIKMPLLGDVPVLGRLFRSESDSAQQTDIVISLTPHILDRRMVLTDDTPLWHGDVKTGPSKKTASGRQRTPMVSEKTAIDDSRIPQAAERVSEPQQEKETGQASMITVSVNPPQTFLTVNGSSAISIDVENAVNVASVPFYIDYDATVLGIREVKEGPFMGSDGMSTVFMSSVDERRGRIIVGLSRVGAGMGISGSGTLVEIYIDGKNPGESPIAFSHEYVFDPGMQTIPADFVDGSVVVADESDSGI